LPDHDVYALDGRQKKALHAALRHAFPRPAALERLVEFHLDEHLAVIAGEGALDDVIFRVIAWSEAQGRLDALVNGARAEAPGNPQLIAFERTVVEARDARPQDVPLRQFAERVQLAPAVPDEPDLEKRVFRAGFSDIAQWRARLGQAELAVCRIESPAWRALGTGFLVGPDLVMTNRHVVEALAAQPAPPLLVRFDFKLSPDGSRLREGETFQMARDWLVTSSAVAQLDYAVLRLATPAGLKPTGGTASAPPRGWITPQWRDLEPDETIFVIQHPLGETLKLASGRYDGREPTRLRYRVDTEPGSSGSPCFTAQMELVALHRGSAEGLANQGVPFDAIVLALPPGLLPAARPEAASWADDVPAESLAAAAGQAARPATEGITATRRGWSLGLVAAGAAVMVALVAVLLWLSRADAPATPVRPATTVASRTAAQAPPPVPTRRPVREVSVPYAISQIAAPQGDASTACRSDGQNARALFRLESTGAWPAASGPRAREVQLVAVGEIEIEDASIVMMGGVDAATVAQPRREIARKWLFAEPITAPIVIVACVRSTTGQASPPAFRISTWKEIAP
jgi:Effector-associated domain 1/Trypsin-like peptidase domain